MSPAAPDSGTREHLLGVLGEFVARGGASPLLLPPIAPGADAFPEPWAPTRAGVALLLRRLVWHAGIERAIEVDDRRFEKPPPTERKPATRVELLEVHGDKAVFALGFVGTDDVVGTLAHEVGAIHAALNRPGDPEPYRTAEPPVIAVDHDRDPERGSIATVYLGLGVLAANAAHQEYNRPGRFNGAWEPLEHDVLCAGALDMSSLAFLVAVQAVVRGDDVPPAGLRPPQRDEVAGWIAALRPERSSLRERLGIAASVELGTRPELVAFEAGDLADDETRRANAFRWQTHRGGVGFFAGAVFGIGVAFAVSRGMMPFTAFGGATAGHLVGRRVRTPRCSACATVVAIGASTCRKCGARLRGDIAHLGDRLAAEEALEERDGA